MPVKLFESVIISARKLSIGYKRLNNGTFPCPVQLNALTPSGWVQDSVDRGCVKAASQLIKKPIEVYDFPPLGVQNPLAALVENYDTRAVIYVSSTQNYCWRRFLVAKELAHLIMCNDSNQTPITPSDVTSLLSDLINNVSPGENKILQAESLAYYAAIEILLPMELATIAAKRLIDGESISELAKAYRIPRKVMELRLTEPTTIDYFNQAYASYRFTHLEFSAISA